MASLLFGINTDRVSCSANVCYRRGNGGGWRALLGQFYGVINPCYRFYGRMKAFTAAVLGGIGSIPGAMTAV